MIYDPSNTHGATVFDVDTKKKISMVRSINTDEMTVTCFEYPLRVAGDTAATYDIHYRTIYPIYGGGHTPCLFHCYGRML